MSHSSHGYATGSNAQIKEAAKRLRESKQGKKNDNRKDSNSTKK